MKNCEYCYNPEGIRFPAGTSYGAATIKVNAAPIHRFAVPRHVCIDCVMRKHVVVPEDHPFFKVIYGKL